MPRLELSLCSPPSVYTRNPTRKNSSQLRYRRSARYSDAKLSTKRFENSPHLAADPKPRERDLCFEKVKKARRPRPAACRDLRCKIRSYLTPIFSANFADFRQLVRARSRLYRSRFLQPNTHFAALFEIYKNIISLHRSEFNTLANFRRKVFAIFKISFNILICFTIFIGFCTDSDHIFSEFR